jgi:hypothetical protein
VLLADVQPQPLAALTRSGLMEEIGGENVLANLEEAIGRARTEVE